jgi:hypothetical protein
MDIMSEFREVCREFPALRQAFEAVRRDTQDPVQRAFLNDLADSLDRGFAEFKKNIPEVVADLDRMEVEADAQHAANVARVEEIHRQLAALPAAAAVPAAVPAVAALVFPPELGQTLRDRLLARYGDAATRPAAPRDAGNVHEMASSDYNVWESIDAKSPPAPPPAPAAPAPKPRAVEADRGGSIGGMHSMDWDNHGS